MASPPIENCALSESISSLDSGWGSDPDKDGFPTPTRCDTPFTDVDFREKLERVHLDLTELSHLLRNSRSARRHSAPDSNTTHDSLAESDYDWIERPDQEPHLRERLVSNAATIRSNCRQGDRDENVACECARSHPEPKGVWPSLRPQSRDTSPAKGLASRALASGAVTELEAEMQACAIDAPSQPETVVLLSGTQRWVFPKIEKNQLLSRLEKCGFEVEEFDAKPHSCPAGTTRKTQGGKRVSFATDKVTKSSANPSRDRSSLGKANKDKLQLEVKRRLGELEEADPRFGCPFAKKDPDRYERVYGKACTIPPGLEGKRIKEHLQRVHSRLGETKCRFCGVRWSVVSTEANANSEAQLNELEAHFDPSNGRCAVPNGAELSVPEYMTRAQEEVIANMDATERLTWDQRWTYLFMRLFPRHYPIPGPYYDFYTPTHQVSRPAGHRENAGQRTLFYTVFSRPSGVQGGPPAARSPMTPRPIPLGRPGQLEDAQMNQHSTGSMPLNFGRARSSGSQTDQTSNVPATPRSQQRGQNQQPIPGSGILYSAVPAGPQLQAQSMYPARGPPDILRRMPPSGPAAVQRQATPSQDASMYEPVFDNTGFEELETFTPVTEETNWEAFDNEFARQFMDFDPGTGARKLP